MFIPLFRTSLGQSAQLVTVSRRSVSQFVGTVNRNLIARSSLGSHAIHSRNLTTTFAVNAAPKAAVAVKKKSTKPVKKKRVVAKKRTVKKKAPPPKKKKKTKKPVKLAAPKITKKDWTPPFKRPLTAWAKFVSKSLNRASDQPIVLKDYLTAASTEWKTMSAEQKAAYAPSPSEREEYSLKLAEWNATLPKDALQARRKWKRSRRTKKPAPLKALPQYMKENFNQTQYPSDVVTTPDKFRHLVKAFYSEVSDSDKEALKQRAEEEFNKKHQGVE